MSVTGNTHNVVVGAGPAAAALVAALTQDARQTVTVLDVGARLEDWRSSLLTSLTGTPVARWSEEDRRILSQQPRPVGTALPEKRAYGSDFPFRDLGQLEGVSAEAGANDHLVSGAFGGFSNVWGAQVMPWSRATIDRWPISYADMTAAYRAVLDLIPWSGADDDLSELFPLFGRPDRLPELAPRTQAVLDRYERYRHRIRPLGVTVGAARLAMSGEKCHRCGLCMTGCPDGLIFSASRLMSELVKRPAVSYRPQSLVVDLTERPDGALVRWKDLAGARLHEMQADRVFVAAGGVGSTRLLAKLLRIREVTIPLQEALQFVLPAVSLRPMQDPRGGPAFTLNQFSLAVQLDEDGRDLPFVHFYPYNDAMLDALPAPLRSPAANPAQRALLRRFSVGLGYLPSWASPMVDLRLRDAGTDRLPTLTVGRAPIGAKPPMLKAALGRLRRAAPWLDLWPLPMVRMAEAAKSYHFGSTLPHAPDEDPRPLVSDRLGRPRGVRHHHFVDGAVLPDVAATTFTLTVMANAYRIGAEVLVGQAGAVAL